MRATLALITLLTLLIVSTPGAHGAPPALETILPAGTDLLLVIDDASTFMEKWKTGPWGTLWNEPLLKPFTGALADSMKVDTWDDKVLEETGHSLTELLENLSGQVALIVPDVSAFATEEETGETAPIALVVTVEDESLFPPRLARYFALDDTDIEDVEESEEIYEGQTLHLFAPAGKSMESGWAVVNGLAVVAEPVSYLKEMISGITGSPPTAPLSGLAEFQLMKENVALSDVYLYMNLTTLGAMVEEEMAKDEDDELEAFGFDSNAVLRAMRLDVLQGFYFSMGQTDTESRVNAGLVYREDAGVVKLMAHPPGPIQRPTFIPEDVIGAAVSRFSLTQFWEAMTEILDAANPGLSMMLVSQAQELLTPMGLDFEQDIIGGFGENDWAAYFPPPAGTKITSRYDMDQVIGMEIRNPEAMNTLIDGLLSMFGDQALQSHTVEDVTVWSMDHGAVEAAMKHFSYALTDNYMLIGVGERNRIDTMIQAMKKPGKSVWDRKDLAKDFAALPADASSIGYYDMGPVIRLALEGVQMEMEANGDPMSELSAQDLDTLSRYFGPMFTSVTKRENGLFVSMHMIHGKPGSGSGRR